MLVEFSLLDRTNSSVSCITFIVMYKKVFQFFLFNSLLISTLFINGIRIPTLHTESSYSSCSGITLILVAFTELFCLVYFILYNYDIVFSPSIKMDKKWSNDVVKAGFGFILLTLVSFVHPAGC